MNFEEEAPVNTIGNTVIKHDNLSIFNYYHSINPIDNIVELYEALVKSEREKADLLQKIWDKMK